MKYSLLLCTFALLVHAEQATAQNRIRPSQKATVSQFIANNNEISVTYNRPVARGRTLFGDDGIIKYDKVWMPGANEATYIEFPIDVRVNGELLEEGKYSIWAIPNHGEWEIMFSKDWDQWHTQYPGEEEDALRIKITPEESSHMEVLAYYFSLVSNDATTLNLHWGTTVLAMEIELEQ